MREEFRSHFFASRTLSTSAIWHHHEVAFCADDTALVDGYCHFIASSLKSGKAVIAIINASHHTKVVPKLQQADGIDVAAAIEQGRYFPCDTADALPRLIVNDMPDPVRCAGLIWDLVARASKAVQRRSDRVAVCGEIAPTLLSQGDGVGAIRLEHIWGQITRDFGIHTLCGYLYGSFPGGECDQMLQRICAEHSASRMVASNG